MVDAGSTGHTPLAGLTILDLTRVLSGPYCTMLLGDMGARVIKVEQPGRGDETREWGPPFLHGESACFLGTNRNKESICLDLNNADARGLLDRLIARADVLVENFRPGLLQRLGLDYHSIASRHPSPHLLFDLRLWTTGSAARPTRLRRCSPGRIGLMSITGPENGPPFRLGVAVADLVAGLLAAQGVTLALLARMHTARGQQVDSSLLDSAVSLLSYKARLHLNGGTRDCTTQGEDRWRSPTFASNC